MGRPLAGVRVIELAEGVSGPYVGKLFADFGADVIKVESPAGDRTRAAGPFGPEGPHPDTGAQFLHLNTNKRSVVLDRDDEEDRARLDQLLATADVVVESDARSNPNALDVDALRELHPRLVVTSITPFGLTGPYAHHLGEEIVTYAMGGPMNATGLIDREPVKMAGDVISYQVGNVAATATIGALWLAEQTGEGVHIDHSAFECQAASIDRRMTYLLHHQFTGTIPGRSERQVQRPMPLGMFPTAEGWVQILTTPGWVPRMVEVLDDDELRERYSRPDWLGDEELPDLMEAVLYGWLSQRTAHEATVDAQAQKWAITELNKPLDLLDDPHLAAREFLIDVDHPAAGRIRQLGPPIRLAEGWSLDRPAPTLGQHTDEVLAEHHEPADDLPASERNGATDQPPTEPAPPPAEPAQPHRLPLDGIRVLDLTVVWAGPAVTMFLGDLGAEIIRVDNPFVFPMATRGNMPRPPDQHVPDLGPLAGCYPDFDPGERPWNRTGFFAAHARGKRSVTLDLRTDLGRETFFRLVEQSDLLVENNSVSVIDKLGIGWDELSARNPRFSVLRMPPAGLDGPYAGFIGYGAHFEAQFGLTAIRGYPDGDPTSNSTVFHMDPASGAAGAFAAMMALRRREHTGRGELIELPQAENMLQHIGEYVIDAARTGADHEPIANRHGTRAPQGAYRCAGADRWVTISVGSDEQWTGLVRAIGGPGWGHDERFATMEGRRAHHDEIDELLETWTSGLDRFDVFERCQIAGVPAGPVLDEADLLADPHLAERGFFRENGSDELGHWQFSGHAWRWSGPDLAWGPIGVLGGDNDEVLRDIAGLSAEEYAELDASGQISLDYLQPDGTPF